MNFNHTGQPENEYTYAVDGSKLQVNHKKSSGGKVTDYVGNMIYEGGSLKRILVDGGFYEEGKYYFYLRDHLGNNRVVADASGSAIQVTHYYPFGMSFAEGVEQDIKPAKQPYKYNGKELDGENSLNWYDYEARQLAMDVPRFTTMDPHAENYFSWSPYVYVGNNPMRLVDVNGKEWGIRVNANGTQTITLSVNLSASSSLSAAQVDSYKAQMSAQLHNTIYAASGGSYSAEMSFNGGTDPNRFTPTIVLDDSSDGMALGMYSPGSELVSLYPNKAESLLEFGETSVHELFHTLNIDDVAASPYISDTKMNISPNGYLTTPGTAKNIHKNIMNYPGTKIDGKSYRQIYNSTSGMNQLTKGQLNFLIRSIYKQMGGYGQKPIRQKNESDLEYAKRYKKYYEDYWNNPEDM